MGKIPAPALAELDQALAEARGYLFTVADQLAAALDTVDTVTAVLGAAEAIARQPNYSEDNVRYLCAVAIVELAKARVVETTP